MLRRGPCLPRLRFTHDKAAITESLDALRRTVRATQRFPGIPAQSAAVRDWRIFRETASPFPATSA